VLALFFGVLRNDDIHGGLAKRAHTVNLVFLQDFLVATSVHFVPAGRDCVECILRAHIGPGVIICFGKHGDEAIVLVLFGLFAQTAKLLLYLFLLDGLLLKRK